MKLMKLLFGLLIGTAVFFSTGCARSKAVDTSITVSEENYAMEIPAVPDGAIDPRVFLNDEWGYVGTIQVSPTTRFDLMENQNPDSAVTHALICWIGDVRIPWTYAWATDEGNLLFICYDPETARYEWDPTVDEQTYNFVRKLFEDIFNIKLLPYPKSC